LELGRSLSASYFLSSDLVSDLPALSIALRRKSDCVWISCWAISRADSVIFFPTSDVRSIPCGNASWRVVRNRATASAAARPPSSSPGLSRGFGCWAARLNGKVLLTWDDKGCRGLYHSRFEEHFPRERYRMVARSCRHRRRHGGRVARRAGAAAPAARPDGPDVRAVGRAALAAGRPRPGPCPGGPGVRDRRRCPGDQRLPGDGRPAGAV